MPADKKNWVAPRVLSIDSARIFKQAWTREQLMHMRTLVAQTIELIEADDRLLDAVAKLRSILREVDAELSRSDES